MGLEIEVMFLHGWILGGAPASIHGCIYDRFMTTSSMQSMAFGRTGHDSSRIIFGAAALFRQDWGQDWAEALADTVVARGVNHFDTAASYGDSEDMLKPWLASNRSKVFLATKTGERDGAAARAELERSLERMGVDSVDLIQLHNLVEEDEWSQAHGTGGALEAMVTARDEGLVRFIGVTGHGLRIAGMHRRSLDAFDYDSVLLPWNSTLARNDSYRIEFESLLATCAERNVAVQTIKSIARRRWTNDENKRDRRSWYEPLTDAGRIERAMQVVLANPQVFLNTSSDARLMDEMLGAAERIFTNAGDGPVHAPDTATINADIAAHDMSPLFDGAELELI